MSYAPMAGSVVTGTIADLAVTTGKINDGAITTAKIAAGAVVQADIASNVAGTGPAFRAYSAGGQSISAATTTKVLFNTENFDTNNNFASSRFTPTVAGYYQVNAVVSFTTGAGQAVIFKNGSTYQTGIEVTYNASLGGHIPISDIVFCNGSTDYIEIYIYLTTGTTIGSGESNTSFSAAMVRAS
jgi:hypothetical protein